jgi:hypothetical protein
VQAAHRGVVAERGVVGRQLGDVDDDARRHA